MQSCALGYRILRCSVKELSQSSFLPKILSRNVKCLISCECEDIGRAIDTYLLKFRIRLLNKKALTADGHIGPINLLEHKTPEVEGFLL